MAKLTALPAQDIISGLAGVIDYYVRDGVAIAREWPRPPTGERAPGVQAQWPIFAEAATLWNTLDPTVQAAYKTMAAGSTMSGRDIMTKMYINAKLILPY
jgi:hypothetical protein